MSLSCPFRNKFGRLTARDTMLRFTASQFNNIEFVYWLAKQSPLCYTTKKAILQAITVPPFGYTANCPKNKLDVVFRLYRYYTCDVLHCQVVNYNFRRFSMANIMGYGVSIRNTPIDINKTVAYQEISAIGISDSDIIIDIVRADSYNRPELEKLIETLNPGDRIDMYSIDALLQGDSRKAIGYYSAILTKGIELLICDFSGAIAKLSPFSTLRFGNRELGEEFFEKNEVPSEDLIMSFSQYAVNYKPKKNSGGLRTQERLNQSAAFKEIYYAYE